DDQVHLEPDQLGRQVGQPVDPTLRISIVDDDILALNPPELAQPLPERVEQGRPIGRGRQAKKTYPRHPSRLLGLGGEWRGEEAASEHRHEGAPLNHRLKLSTCTRRHHDRTSSACIEIANQSRYGGATLPQRGELWISRFRRAKRPARSSRPACSRSSLTRNSRCCRACTLSAPSPKTSRLV